MKRIWRMAGVGLLMVTVGAQAVAEERDNGPRGDGGGQHERGPEGGRPGGMNSRARRITPRVHRTTSLGRKTISHVRRISILIEVARTVADNGRGTPKVTSRAAAATTTTLE